LNMTYMDQSSGKRAYCDALCPLPQGNTTAQDFTFVNIVGMNSFRIDISDWWGAGAGLNGIQLFQDGTFFYPLHDSMLTTTAMYSYAINDFNEPKNCGPSSSGSEATKTGNWQVTPSHGSTSQYLTASLQGNPSW
jgi:hypothetical protein